MADNVSFFWYYSTSLKSRNQWSSKTAAVLADTIPLRKYNYECANAHNITASYS